jgi:transcriptional regulator with XRE-family HTH domain
MPKNSPVPNGNQVRLPQQLLQDRAQPPSATVMTTEVDVGRRLRELRGRQKLSIRALAEKSGLNPNTLSLIENRKTSPSVATLQQVAGALNVPVTSFFETSADTQKVTYQKAGERPGVPFKRGLLYDLGAGIARRGIEPFLLVLEPRAGSGPTPIVHTGREFVFCLEGQLSYRIAGQDYVLEPGDSLLFEAYLAHHWENVGDRPSRSLLILCPADERDQPTEQHFMGNGGR